MKKIEFKRINVNVLISLLQNIELINYWIKRKETGIPKSAFYNIKKHLLNYIMLCCQNNVYNNDEISYVINNIEINIDYSKGKSYPNKLISMTLFIKDKVFKFHRILDKTLIEIIGKDIIDNLEEKEYAKTQEIFDEIGVNNLQKLYKSLINVLAHNEWIIYRYIDDYNWINIIKERYNLFKIVADWNVYKGLEPKNKQARIKFTKSQKYEKQIKLDFNQFRLKPNSMLKELLPKEQYHINYNLTTIN